MIFRIFILLLLASCFRDQSSLNQKILNQVSPAISHLDPQLATGLNSVVQLGKVYETLVEKHPFGSPYDLLPSLAKNMPKLDSTKTKYVFELRENVYYHDSPCFAGKTRTVRADDFVNSFKRIADPRLNSPHYGFWKKKIKGLEDWYNANKELKKTNYEMPLEGVKALADDRLQVTIKEPDLYFIHSLTVPSVAPIPMEAILYFKNDFANDVIGTGAFVLERYTRKNSIVFKKNPHFWYKTFPKQGLEKYADYFKEYAGKQIPFVDKIKVHIMDEGHTQWLSFMKGNLDYLEVPKDNFTQAITPDLELTADMKKKGINLGISPSLTNLYYLAFNNKHPFLANLHLRKAISYAINLEKFNHLFFNGTADIAQSILPAGVVGNTPPIERPHLAGNLELAKKELSLAGYPNGEGLKTLELTMNNTTLGRQIGEFFVKELAQIGIKVQLDIVSWVKLLDKINKSKFDLFYLAWFVGLPTGFEFFNLVYGPNYPGSYNRVGFTNSEFDSLYDKAFASTSINVHEKYFRLMNEITQKKLPLLPLVHVKDFFLRQGWLKNYVPAEVSGGFEQYYDIDLAQKKKLIQQF